MDGRRKVCGLIILYNPTVKQLQRIEKVSLQCDTIIVDNTVDNSEYFSLLADHNYIPLNVNMGIAYAQNIGLREIKRRGYDYILFLDQDTLLLDGFVEQLLQVYVQLEKVYKIGLLGPTIIDEKSGKEHTSVIHRIKQVEDHFLIKYELISSGSIMSIKILDEVGYLEESLFIDYVDYEFSWRLKKSGYLNGITNLCEIRHNIGEKMISFLWFRINISSPFRYYYQYRNYLVLCRRGYVPLKWKIFTGIKFFSRILYFPIFIKRGFLIQRKMISGIIDSFKYKYHDSSNNSNI